MAETSPSCSICAKPQHDLASPLLRCSRCKTTTYCSKACQTTGWPIHKTTCQPWIPVFSGPPTVPSDGRKRVLLFELEDYSWLGNMYDSFHASMAEACKYEKVTKLDAAMAGLESVPNAVILFEPAIMNQKKQIKYQAINATLRAYVKAGGSIVFGCQCSSHVIPSSLNQYFKEVWDLSWTMGNYARFRYAVNPAASRINGREVPSDYNCKAVQLAGVDEASVVYWQAGESFSMAGLPTPDDPGRTSGPVVWQKYGEGWVGWTGDVNNEEETRVITRMMCCI
jgi:hypothetical protein